jgi:hypothetical protein
MLIYNITAFPNIRQPDRQIKLAYSWTNLCRFLGAYRKPVIKIKQGAWSPASFEGKRSNENVTKLSCLVLDIDDSIDTYTAGANLMVRGVKSYIHTSVSHNYRNQRFRIVLPLADNVRFDQWVYYHLALKTWFAEVFGEDARFDESTKDAARAYYVGYHTEEFWENHIDGKILDWEGRAQDEEYKYQKELQRRKEEQEEKMKRAEQLRKKLGNNVSFSDKRKYMYKVLRNDEGARRLFARWLGATIKGGKHGERAILWSCPRCGKNDCTYFYLDPTRYPSAYCNHRNNCNWKESVGYLAEINGYTI